MMYFSIEVIVSDGVVLDHIKLRGVPSPLPVTSGINIQLNKK